MRKGFRLIKFPIREDSYRTTLLNAALALILQKNKGLENEKTGQMLFRETLSGEMPVTGQLSNHFVEGMRKIYELEPFIKMGSLPTECPSKGLKRYQRAC